MEGSPNASKHPEAGNSVGEINSSNQRRCALPQDKKQQQKKICIFPQIPAQSFLQLAKSSVRKQPHTQDIALVLPVK